MPRSVWKGPYVERAVLKGKGSKRPVKVWGRSSDIIPSMIDTVYAVHDGKKHVNIAIKPEMVGHKLGEFVPTRKFIAHAGSKIKIASKKRWGQK